MSSCPFQYHASEYKLTIRTQKNELIICKKQLNSLESIKIEHSKLKFVPRHVICGRRADSRWQKMLNAY